MDPQVLTNEEIKTTWNRAGVGTATMQADPDTKDADGTDGDTTDKVDGDTDGDTTDNVDGDTDGTDS
jgi:hypothetical protein